MGELKGAVRLFGADASTLTQRESASRIGFVSQDPDMQIVTHKVWHELAFLGENLGQPEDRIRRRVCEIADFFGISDLFERPVEELSGGQKQILNLAAAMAGDPELLLLDEPTSMLDPVAAQDFTDRLVKRRPPRRTAYLPRCPEGRREDSGAGSLCPAYPRSGGGIRRAGRQG